MSSSGSLVVRVKRRRDQDPAQELIVCEEDDAPTSKKAASEALLQEMQGLSTIASAGPAAARQIVLRRVTTLSAAAGSQMDAVLSSARKRGPDEAELPQPLQQQHLHPQNAGGGRESIWVTQNKRAVRSQEDGASYVVVDISQVPYHTPAASSTTDDDNKKNPRSPIASPPTRRLEAAIELAWLKNDFNDIAYAIVQGADINHQRPSASSSKESSDGPAAPHLLQGGETALMAAARRCNLRMVSRLLSVGANVFLTDCRGMTAMDHLKQGQASETGVVGGEAFQEISLKLHAAALRSHRARGDAAAGTAESDDAASPSGAAGEEDDGEFVVDVFCAAGEGDEAAASSSSSSAAAAAAAAAASSSGQTHSRAAPVVQVGGIKIGQDGAVDLVLAYDSDWSDLGDDEDPDSNDERYHGNDYPDEQDDEEDEEDEGGDEDENYMARRREYQQRSSKKDDSDEDDFDEDEDEDGLNAGGLRGLRQSTGHVVRHTLQGGDPFAPAPHTRESIRRLWGESSGLGSDDESEDDEEEEEEEEDEEEEEEDCPRQGQKPGASVRERFGSGWAGSMGAVPARQHRDRVAQMRQASGMEFGSDPRQFDSAGLAKYGAELSDEGEDDAMAMGHSPLDTKPPRDALAFDPEFDLETDED